jgi:hypothetical protein
VAAGPPFPEPSAPDPEGPSDSFPLGVETFVRLDYRPIHGFPYHSSDVETTWSDRYCLLFLSGLMLLALKLVYRLSESTHEVASVALPLEVVFGKPIPSPYSEDMIRNRQRTDTIPKLTLGVKRTWLLLATQSLHLSRMTLLPMALRRRTSSALVASV